MSVGLATVLLGLTSLALAILLVPLLLRRRADTSRESYNLAVYRDQLAEIERDLGRGLLSPEQAEMARAEIGRRILALPSRSANPHPNPPPQAGEGGTRRQAVGGWGLGGAITAVLLLPFAAWLLYARLGSPALPDQPFAERATAAKAVASGVQHLDLSKAIAKISAHLKDHPEDLTGWLLLARTEVSLGQYAEAVEAYRHAVDLTGHRADIMGDWGEAQVLAANGTVTPAAREAFQAALADKESAPRSRYYLALAQYQQGDAKAALQGWVDLAADSPADAEWQPLLRQRIAEAAAQLGVDPASLKTSSGLPSQAAVAAASQATAGASPEERRAMILGMVGNLAARLEQQPDDVEGWARLGRSYMVLGEPQKARDAYAHAVKLKPDDPALKEAHAEANRAAGRDGK
jgi:cytochrome c-type biogenesis protein CcmH